MIFNFEGLVGIKRREISNKKEKKKVDKRSIKEKVTEVLELPKEVVLDVPRLMMVGYKSLFIENYTGVIEYSNNKMRVNTGVGILVIMGAKLGIKEITTENMMIEGEIQSVSFLK